MEIPSLVKRLNLWRYDTIARLVCVLAAVVFSLTELWASELSLTTSFTYNENDAVETVTTADGVVATLTYDAADRLTGVNYSQGGGGISSITYTDLDLISSVTDSAGTIQFHYDPHFYSISDVMYPGAGGSIHYIHDGWGRVANVRTGGDNGESYRYDQEGRIIQVSAEYGATITDYDPQTGRVVQVKLGNGITIDYSHDSESGVVTTVTQRQPRGGLIAQYSYTYYTNGLKESVTETSPERGTETVTYEYDELLRLSRAIYDLADLSQRIESYEYDANGNRLRRHVTLDSETVEDTRYRYNGLNQIVQAGNEVIYHDYRGNIVRRVLPGSIMRETTYHWDSANRLVGVVKKENTQTILSVAYLYNALDQRVSCSVSHSGNPAIVTNYVNSAGALYQPLKIDCGETTTLVYPGGNAYRMKGKMRYELSGNGDVSRVLSSNGQLVASYRYDAFGRILEEDGDVTNEHSKRYRGEGWDKEVGLLYLRNRYYDPDLGRFLSLDPHPGFITRSQSLNPYVYCYNDPVNYEDPTGLCPDSHPALIDGQPRVAGLGVNLHLHGPGVANNPTSNPNLGWRSEGTYTVMAHGSTLAYILDQRNGPAHLIDGQLMEPGKNNVVMMTPAQLSVLIKQDKNFSSSQDVFLYVCYAGYGGENSFAQQLANFMDTVVWGANEEVRLNNSYPMVNHVANGGRYQPFYPQGWSGAVRDNSVLRGILKLFR